MVRYSRSDSVPAAPKTKSHFLRVTSADILQAMEIAEAKLAVDQILNEECERPTIGYEDIANEWVNRHKKMTPQEISAWSKITSVPRKNLVAQRIEV